MAFDGAVRERRRAELAVEPAAQSGGRSAQRQPSVGGGNIRAGEIVDHAAGRPKRAAIARTVRKCSITISRSGIVSLRLDFEKRDELQDLQRIDQTFFEEVCVLVDRNPAVVQELAADECQQAGLRMDSCVRGDELLDDSRPGIAHRRRGDPVFQEDRRGNADRRTALEMRAVARRRPSPRPTRGASDSPPGPLIDRTARTSPAPRRAGRSIVRRRHDGRYFTKDSIVRSSRSPAGIVSDPAHRCHVRPGSNPAVASVAIARATWSDARKSTGLSSRPGIIGARPAYSRRTA